MNRIEKKESTNSQTAFPTGRLGELHYQEYFHAGIILIFPETYILPKF